MMGQFGDKSSGNGSEKGDDGGEGSGEGDGGDGVGGGEGIGLQMPVKVGVAHMERAMMPSVSDFSKRGPVPSGLCKSDRDHPVPVPSSL